MHDFTSESSLWARVTAAGASAELTVVVDENRVLFVEETATRVRTMCVRFLPDRVTISVPVSVVVSISLEDEDDSAFVLEILDALLRGQARETLKFVDGRLYSDGWHVGFPEGHAVGLSASPSVADKPGHAIQYTHDPWGVYGRRDGR